MFKIVALAVSSMMLSSVAVAEVKDDCSAKMNGEIKCEFSNNGTKKDSVCVIMEVVRLEDAKIYSRSTLGGKGAALTSEKICSGLVEPQDIKERSPTASWKVDGVPMTPMGFCDSDNPWFKASTNCAMTTKKVSN